MLPVTKTNPCSQSFAATWTPYGVGKSRQQRTLVELATYNFYRDCVVHAIPSMYRQSAFWILSHWLISEPQMSAWRAYTSKHIVCFQKTLVVCFVCKILELFWDQRKRFSGRSGTHTEVRNDFSWWTKLVIQEHHQKIWFLLRAC